jgi:hypothetical protein
MYITCLLGFLIIFSYCAIITIKEKELPNSISQIVYSLDKKWKWTFSAVMFIVAFMIVPQLMVVATDKYAWLAFLIVTGILGVGADPLDKNSKNIVHYASAIVMGVASQVLIFLLEPLLLLLWAPYICYTLYEAESLKNMFLGEMVILLSVALLCFVFGIK